MAQHFLRRGRRFSVNDCSGTPYQTVLNGLISQWKWNGNGVDFIGGYDATLVGSPTFTNGSNNKSNAAISFNGSQYAYASGTNLNNWAAISFSFWFYMISIPQQYTRLLEKGANNEVSIITGNTGTGDNRVCVQQLGGSNALMFSSNYTLNVWHHVVVTISQSNPAEIVLYLDGTYNNSAVSAQPSSKTNNVYFSQFGAGGYGYNGYMDDARVYNRVLSESEVSIIYENLGE